jgi:hypothetical protein
VPAQGTSWSSDQARGYQPPAAAAGTGPPAVEGCFVLSLLMCCGPASVDGPPVLLNAVPALSDHVLQAGANDDTVVVVVYLSAL